MSGPDDKNKLRELVIRGDFSLEQRKIEELQIITEDQKAVMLQALEYRGVPYFPITEDFITTYILNDTEYPTLEGKISQAVTEMKGRLGNLINMNYEYLKALMDYEELCIELEGLEEERDDIQVDMNNLLSDLRVQVKEYELKTPERTLKKVNIKIARKQLELQMLKHRLNGMHSGVANMYNEFTNWKTTVDKYIATLKEQVPEVEGLEDIRFDLVRVQEMQIKINRWKKKHMQGGELTPSQQVFVEGD